MFPAVTAIAVLVACVLIAVWIKRRRDRRELELHSITPEALHTLMASNMGVLLLDVRLPLDLLTDAEIIPGATRIDPQDVVQNPSLVPQDRDAVVYCTCPGDKTSMRVLRRARATGISQIKFLKGGLAGWKAKGYPVMPYKKPFHLDTEA